MYAISYKIYYNLITWLFCAHTRTHTPASTPAIYLACPFGALFGFFDQPRSLYSLRLMYGIQRRFRWTNRWHNTAETLQSLALMFIERGMLSPIVFWQLLHKFCIFKSILIVLYLFYLSQLFPFHQTMLPIHDKS